MGLYEWLLFLHVLSAFVLVGALVALWALVLATRPSAPVLGADGALRFGRLAGPLVGAGMVGTIGFGIWLAVDIDRYALWDGWIVASLALWVVAGWSGDAAGRAFRRDPVGSRRNGIRLQALNSLLVVVILSLMIWKPGA